MLARVTPNGDIIVRFGVHFVNLKYGGSNRLGRIVVLYWRFIVNKTPSVPN